jgi:hypothetical protein
LRERPNGGDSAKSTHRLFAARRSRVRAELTFERDSYARWHSTDFPNPYVIVFGAALFAAAIVPAPVQATPNAAAPGLQPLQTFAIRPGSDAALGFQTLPGARCTIANLKGDPFVFYADANGSARFHVRPAPGVSQPLALTAQCAARGVAAAIPLAADRFPSGDDPAVDYPCECGAADIRAGRF